MALNHPLVTAIQENSGRLQAADIQEMPDQLIKISTSLYNTLMPLVKDQVRSQIKVADMTKMRVDVSPADYNNWSEVSETLTKEAIAPIKSEHRRALQRLKGVENFKQRQEEVNSYYTEQIEAKMEEISSQPLEFQTEIELEYNFLENNDEMPLD